jgi:hypothetical protein
MNYFTLVYGVGARVRFPEDNPGAYGARTRNLRRDRAAL